MYKPSVGKPKLFAVKLSSASLLKNEDELIPSSKSASNPEPLPSFPAFQTVLFLTLRLLLPCTFTYTLTQSDESGDAPPIYKVFESPAVGCKYEAPRLKRIP